MSGARRRQIGAVDRLPSGRWRVRLVDPATGRRVSIGSYRTKAEAEVAFAAALTNQGKGAWVAPDKGRVTLNEYAPKWLATRLTSRGEPLRPKTVELYESFLRLHILPTLGPVPRPTHHRYRPLVACGPSRPGPRYGFGRQVLPTAPHDPGHGCRGRRDRG